MNRPNARPLAKALHTVTSTANVARYLRANGSTADAVQLTRDALAVLGYSQAQLDASDSALLGACVAAVAKIAPAHALALVA